jgi:hypothetical protein
MYSADFRKQIFIMDENDLTYLKLLDRKLGSLIKFNKLSLVKWSMIRIVNNF